MKPTVRPARPHFSSGPCAKHPGWTPVALADALVGRSHRAAEGKARLKAVIDQTRALLGLPEGWRVGIVPASDTGAVEMALWSLLGSRGVDVLAWESFGKGWVTDVVKQLKLGDVRLFEADYGELPELSGVDFGRDVVTLWNGTTSGVCLPNADWIAADREGLVICDATSAVMAMEMDWRKIDAATFSWQKVLGGEAAHGMLLLGPRAAERLQSYTPPWPLPKIFRLTKGGEIIEGIFRGETINTPSMICVEDALSALDWAQRVGGLEGLIGRSRANLGAIEAWVEKTGWVEFLAQRPSERCSTSICLTLVPSGLSPEDQASTAKAMVKLLAEEEVAYDIGSYRDTPPGLRIWGGATVDSADLEALTLWLDWAYDEVAA